MIIQYFLGFACQECNQIYLLGIESYTESWYNLMDSALLCLYFASYTLRYMVMIKVRKELQHSNLKLHFLFRRKAKIIYYLLILFYVIYSCFTTEQGQFALKYILNVNLTDPAQYFFLEWQFYWLNAGTCVHMYNQRKNKENELFPC